MCAVVTTATYCSRFTYWSGLFISAILAIRRAQSASKTRHLTRSLLNTDNTKTVFRLLDTTTYIHVGTKLSTGNHNYYARVSMLKIPQLSEYESISHQNANVYSLHSQFGLTC